jgi:hypothetical protein
MKSIKDMIRIINVAILLTIIFLSVYATGQPGMNTINRSAARNFTPFSLDKAAIPDFNFQRANKLPMTGYFEKSFDVNNIVRTAKFYIAPTAPVRTFFTVIAVPEGIKTTEFLVASGWFDIADKNEEGLVLLEPGNKGWGDWETEQGYINAVMNFYKQNGYFSIFGISYLIGYDGGGTALEAWAAANPLLVISQAFINSKSQSNAYYSRFDTIYMNGLSTGYTPVEIPEQIKFACNIVPVPTAFINSDLKRVSQAISYWKNANDANTPGISSPKYFYGANVFAQSKESDAWATAYAGPISKVITLEKDIDVLNPQFTNKIYDFVTEYVKYENSTAYGNHLAPRKKYGEIKTMIINDEIREYQVYVPDLAEKLWPDGAPVVFAFAGNSQTDKVFFHNTLWWKVADKEGFILVLPCETYSSSSTSVSHSNTDVFYEKLVKYITKYYNVDAARFYATGQSAGSFAVQGFGITNPEYFAAIASTSGLSSPSEEGARGMGRVAIADASYKMMPNYCILGQGDIASMTGTLWDETENMLDTWAAYYLKANNAGPPGDGSNLKTEGRFQTWTWTNKQGFPIFKIGRTLYRAHNCIPAEMPRLWDFLKHWSYKNGVRYYDNVPVQ